MSSQIRLLWLRKYIVFDCLRDDIHFRTTQWFRGVKHWNFTDKNLKCNMFKVMCTLIMDCNNSEKDIFSMEFYKLWINLLWIHKSTPMSWFTLHCVNVKPAWNSTENQYQRWRRQSILATNMHFPISSRVTQLPFSPVFHYALSRSKSTLVSVIIIYFSCVQWNFLRCLMLLSRTVHPIYLSIIYKIYVDFRPIRSQHTIHFRLLFIL